MDYKELTASGAGRATRGELGGAILTGGSDAASAILYDHASAASGDKIATLKAAAGVSIVLNPAESIRFSNGVYGALTGTGPALYLYFL